MQGVVRLSDSIRFLKSSGLASLQQGVVVEQLMNLVLETSAANVTNTSIIPITTISQIWDWCVLGSLTTLLLITQTKYSTNIGSLLFFITAAAVAIGGCAIWSMHFISLLGLQLLLNGEYVIDKLSVDTGLTVSSVVVAIAACWLGFFITSLRPMYHFTIDKIVEWDKKRKLAKVTDSSLTSRSMYLQTYSDLTPRKYLAKIVFDTASGVQSYLKVVDRKESSVSSTDAEAASAALWISYFVNNEVFQIIAAFIMGIAVNGMHYTGQYAAIYSVPTGTTVYSLVTQVLFNLQYGINLQTLLLLISSATCIVCFAMIVIIYSISMRARKNLDKSFASLEAEQQKADKLLLNVLPKSIADRVKAGEKNIVEKLECVTILFADVVEFTKMSSKTSPVTIVQILHEIFCMFDRLALFHEIEKIKTIGDCFMAASGVPEEREDHAMCMMHFATDMLRVMQIFNRRHGTNVQIRIGINSGPIVAGIIGQTKFVYDIYGDSCNVASRTESNGLPDRIVVSQHTYDLVKDKFEFEAREPILFKGKGMMNTYLLKEQHSVLQLNQNEWSSFIEPYSKLKYAIGKRLQKEFGNNEEIMNNNESIEAEQVENQEMKEFENGPTKQSTVTIVEQPYDSA